MTMTLERPVVAMGWVDEAELREIHLRQLAELFDGRHGAERARLAHSYSLLLAEFEREARAIRNVEVSRLSAAGDGPTAIGRVFGHPRARGQQILDAARMAVDRDGELVKRLRRQVAAFKREG